MSARYTFFLLRNARQAEVIPRIPAHHESQIVGSGDFSSGEEKRADCESTEVLHSSMVRRQEQERRVMAHGINLVEHMTREIATGQW